MFQLNATLDMLSYSEGGKQKVFEPYVVHCSGHEMQLQDLFLLAVLTAVQLIEAEIVHCRSHKRSCSNPFGILSYSSQSNENPNLCTLPFLPGAFMLEQVKLAP